VPLFSLFGQEDWTKLGYGKGSYKMTKNKCQFDLSEKENNQIKFITHGGPVRIFKVSIKFKNGRIKTYSVNQTFNHKKTFKVFKIGKKKLIPTEVKVVYKRLVNHKMAPKFVILGQ
jgi:hypothetical protein